MAILGGIAGSFGAGTIWRKYSIYIYYSLVVIYLFAKRVHSATEEVNGGEEKKIENYQVAKFNFEHVSDVYAITLWILLGSLAKVGFHLSHKLTEKFPESCLLIILGLVVGGLLYATKLAEQKAYVLNSDTFFLFLLPPIILEAGYFMPNRPFFDNIGTILLFAIANTLFNTILIGLTLWGFSFTPLYGGTEFEMLHCFVFAALISAVDPVAVLATFVEIHVNDMLYIVVFGESLLNDAVSVVLYRMFDTFADMGSENIKPTDIVLGATSFLIVAFGGVLIGIIFGVIACFTTKFTEHTPVLEPLIILTYSYLSYLTAEMFSTSGLLAITFCGMFMKQYVEFNISKKSNATIEYVLKMLASIMETIIFMFMGLSTVSDHHSWNTGFVLITIVACTGYRILGVILFATIANRWRLLELQITDMLIMSYGGIRGAVAFALALILDESRIPRKKEFVTATIAVVFFTVFLQGTTIGPIVKYFKIKRKEVEEPTMSAKLTNRLIDHVMSCLEEIAGVSGKHSLRDKVRGYDRRFLKPYLLREKFLSKDEKLLYTFKKINEINVNKMAENPDFKLPVTMSVAAQLASARNASIANLLNASLSEVATVPDFQQFGTQPSKRADEDAQIHHLLEHAMYDPRRRQTIHKRSQLDEDTTYRRRASKSVGHTTFHHQNPIILRNLIDTETRFKNSTQSKKRSSSSGHSADRNRLQVNNEKTHRPKQNQTDDKNTDRPQQQQQQQQIKKPNDFANNQTRDEFNKVASTIQEDIPAPPSPSTVIPPPWKTSFVNSSNDEPIRAHMPSWASNPDYTLHATTTKQEDPTRRPVFGIFDEEKEEKFKKEKVFEEPIEMKTTTTTTKRNVTKKTNDDPPKEEPITRL